ncbi:MAG TPA: proton-conducting transporter membrane subunit, partial [Desulfobaccales bacterium]|nr:proton-conducting transporter membrane subunit [Desulfobaccales bacterium]
MLEVVIYAGAIMVLFLFIVMMLEIKPDERTLGPWLRQWAPALAQTDIKRILAYSTISQVGYMILAVGAADIVGGMFHLLSLAFFKSLLFLSAGCVIQALDEEHSIFKMGNLHRLRPMLSYIFLAGALGLSAFPLLGGYFSKDRILLATFIYPDFSYKILWFIALGLGGMFFTSWIALAQTDIKRLVAYSSIGHMSLMVVGVATWNLLSLNGSL